MGGNYKEYNKEGLTLSVLMAVCQRDKATFLDRALSSVWDHQTYKPQQIILVEDGPLTEALYEMITKWKKRLGNNLFLCHNHKNMGLTKSLNIGLRYVNTTLVARMDSDDISLPLRFEWQIAYLQQHPKTDIVGGAIQEFDSAHPCLMVRKYPLTHEGIVKYMEKACPIAHPTVMMRMRIFHQGLHYDEQYPTSQDIALWFEVARKGFKMANMAQIVLRYRRDNGFYKRRAKKKAWNECKIYLKGIYHLKRWHTIAYIYPLMRCCFRLLPENILKWGYEKNLRNILLLH